MSLSDRYQRLPLTSILIDREARQRKTVRIEDLKKSIGYVVPETGLPRGVLNPILVEPASEGLVHLIAGECRVEASRALGLLDIPVRFVDQVSLVERELIELEENIHRTDLEWQDRVSAVARIHALYTSEDCDWTMGETAESCGLNISTVSMYLRVHGELADNDRVAKAGTVREAYNALGRRDARAAGDALEELLEVVAEIGQPAGAEPEAENDRVTASDVGPDGVRATLPEAVPRPYNAPIARPSAPSIPPADATILHTSFLDWAPQYAGQKFNFVHFDPPYGIEAFSGPQARGAEDRVYDDSADTYIRLLTCLCQNLDRLMSLSGHLMLWYSDKQRAVTLDLFRRLAPSLDFRVYPLVWVKSDNAGIAADPKYGPRHVYETALLASRGKRQIVRVVGDAYSAPSDRKLHPSTKPEPMLRHFMTMLVDEHTTMLDPTCGSGASLRAAESLGAKSVLGLEIDEQYVKPARQALTMSRRLRDANKSVRELPI